MLRPALDLKKNAMKSLLALPGLLLVLAAYGCAVPAEDDGDEAESLGVAELGLYVCDGSVDCPGGYIATQYQCGGAYVNGCGVGGPQCVDKNIRNVIGCIDIPDGSDGEAIKNFIGCGTVLHPSPHHYPNSYSYADGCNPNLYEWSTDVANKTYYAAYPPPDSSYASCGLECRAGDYALSYGYASQCNIFQSGSSTAPNRVSCKQVVNASAEVCGIVPCPTSKHYVSKYGNRTNCNTDGLPSSEPNTTSCVVPTSTTTSLYACGSTCPEGFSPQKYLYAASCRPTSASSTSENNQVVCVKS